MLTSAEIEGFAAGLASRCRLW